MNYLRTVAEIWSDHYPPGKPRKHSLAERVVMTPIVLARLISLDQIRVVFGENRRHIFMDLYVLVFASLGTILLFSPSHLGYFGAIFATYRIFDIITYRLYFLLVKSQAQPWSPDFLRRSLLIVIINFYETVVAYAILYSLVGSIIPAVASLSQPFSPSTALYYSVVTATTLGYGEFIPGNDLSRIIVVMQLFSTIVFLMFVIPALMSLFSSTQDSP